MYYIILDLELNSKAYKSKLPNEIIEIGAVKLDNNLNVVGEFQSFVKPKIHQKLFPLIKRKTKIPQESINNAHCFTEVLSYFIKWCENNYILCSWGADDIHHLKENCKLNHMSTKWMKKTFDVQKHFSQLHQALPGHRFSLSKALELLNITPSEDLHRAHADAVYTAEVFKTVFDEAVVQGVKSLKKSDSNCKRI